MHHVSAHKSAPGNIATLYQEGSETRVHIPKQWAGTGFTLSAATSLPTPITETKETHSSTPPVGTPKMVVVSESCPKTRIRIRLSTGKTEQCVFNTTHTIRDVRQHIEWFGKIFF